MPEAVKRNCGKALPKVASCLKCRQAFGWPSRSSRWYRSLLLGTVLRFFSCLTGISGCITTTHRIKDVSWTWKAEASHQTETMTRRRYRTPFLFSFHSLVFNCSSRPVPEGSTTLRHALKDRNSCSLCKQVTPFQRGYYGLDSTERRTVQTKLSSPAGVHAG